jgi:tetratricopeptide (TPR) repeat protein
MLVDHPALPERKSGEEEIVTKTLRMIKTTHLHQQIRTFARRILRYPPILLPGICLLLCAAISGAQGRTSPEDLRQTALVLEQQGKNEEAEAAWHSYLQLHPASSEAYAHLGLLEARQEHYKQAVPLYQKALALHAAIPGLRLNLGLALFKTGAMKEALEQFSVELKGAPQSSPDRQRLTILIGMCHYGLGEYAKAVPYLQRAASDDPQNLQLLLALAHSCLWSKQYQCVLDTYHEILMLNAESAEADMLAGEALDEMKDVTGAIQQFRAAEKADPKAPDVHFGLGYLLWTKRQYTEAEPEFQAELDNNPKHAEALTYLADVEMHLERPETAAPLLEKAIQIDPTIELAHLDLGAIDADAGHNEDALHELETAAKLAPNDVDVHWRLGRLYKAMGNQQKAQAELEKAKSITEAADTALINKMKPPSAEGNASPTNSK